MANCLKLAKKAASSNLSILITGESGTGKNLLAQAIHNHSSRSKGKFVIVNTTALNDSLVESELFGHEKGAFTGAEKQRQGLFESANEGTLVLDEIGDMSLSLQPKLLHTVEYRHFKRLGGTEDIMTSARIISITNRNLDRLVKENGFREDLLFRLRDITINIPPLRERPDDLSLLCMVIRNEEVSKSIKKIPEISEEAIKKMADYHWPGNVREMRSVLRKAFVICDSEKIEPEHIELASEPEQAPAKASSPEPASSQLLSLYEVEKAHILRVLKMADSNKTKAAQILKIHRKTLERKIAQYIAEK
jgi:transcriptional regulator with PAS, ATPase and Fis domain